MLSKTNHQSRPNFLLRTEQFGSTLGTALVPQQTTDHLLVCKNLLQNHDVDGVRVNLVDSCHSSRRPTRLLVPSKRIWYWWCCTRAVFVVEGAKDIPGCSDKLVDLLPVAQYPAALVGVSPTLKRVEVTTRDA